MIASPERAVCDMVYLYGNMHFDNLRPLNADRLEEIKNIYPQKTLLLLDAFIKDVRSSQA